MKDQNLEQTLQEEELQQEDSFFKKVKDLTVASIVAGSVALSAASTADAKKGGGRIHAYGAQDCKIVVEMPDISGIPGRYSRGYITTFVTDARLKERLPEVYKTLKSGGKMTLTQGQVRTLYRNREDILKDVKRCKTPTLDVHRAYGRWQCDPNVTAKHMEMTINGTVKQEAPWQIYKAPFDIGNMGHVKAGYSQGKPCPIKR